MSSNPFRLKYLLEKYIASSCSPQELDEFWKLMSEHSDNDVLEEYFQNLWGSTSIDTDSVDWANLQLRLKEKMKEQRMDFSRVISMRRRKMVRYAAAACLLLCIAGTWWFLRSPLTKAQNLVQSATTYQRITLPDGTTVVLNKNTKLSYPVQFTGSTREVFLTGEALFDVAHNPAKPFRVHTGVFVTRVLGTAFSIKAYPGDSNVKIIVTRGKVEVKRESDRDQILGILERGDQLVVNTSSIAIAKTKVPVTDSVTFEKELLQFENATFQEATKVISQHYTVKFKFKNDALLNCRLTGDFTNDSLPQILDVICTLINASWKQDAETKIIEIEGQGCG
ncbi:MAG TPA: FecR domain-containing protein [Chitinophagaceae bacterium]|nr:FecR domain-containing protein [Chitinophagaceae bacterium]